MAAHSIVNVQAGRALPCEYLQPRADPRAELAAPFSVELGVLDNPGLLILCPPLGYVQPPRLSIGTQHDAAHYR